MKTTSNSRIAAIGKVSSYLNWFTVFFIFIIPIFGLSALGVTWFKLPAGDLTIFKLILNSINMSNGYWDTLKAQGVTAEARVFLMLATLTLVAGLEFLLVQLNQLLTCFSNGEIFNQKALRHARSAFNIAFFGSVFCYVTQFVILVLSVAFWHDGKADYFVRIFCDMLGDTVWVGISLLIIWSLEIGTELNEEAELTI